MPPTIEEATVRRVHHDGHDRLRSCLTDVLPACNFAWRLKTLDCLTPYQDICKVCTSKPDRSTRSPD